MNRVFYICLLVFMVPSIVEAKIIKEYFPNKKLKTVGNFELSNQKNQQRYIKEGKFKAYYMSGELAYEVNYKDDKKNSNMIWYDKDGNIIEIMPYKMGKRDGVEKRFYPNGALKYIVKYVDDKKEGKEKFFYQDGVLAEISNYKNNKREGYKIEYHPNGKILSKVLYKNNYKEGKQVWYDKDGKVTKTQIFKLDRPIEFYAKSKKDVYKKLIDIGNISFNPNQKQN